MTGLCIEQLNIYPVKSLRGISLSQSPLTTAGLAFDRRWMLVMPDGRFITQRQLPGMCLLDTAIEGDSLTLSKAGKGAVRVPLDPDLQHRPQSPFTATVFRDQCDVQEASTEASAWLNRVLNPPQPLRLVAMAPGGQRLPSQPQRFGAGNNPVFADAAPLLVANQASLEAVNRGLRDKALPAVDMRRFRPNIVISGLPAFAEHRFSHIHREDGLTLQLRDHCERCIIVTIDPDTGEKSSAMEPYHLLVKLNSMPDKPRAPAFAVNTTVEIEPGTNLELRVGDRLQAGVWECGPLRD